MNVASVGLSLYCNVCNHNYAEQADVLLKLVRDCLNPVKAFSTDVKHVVATEALGQFAVDSVNFGRKLEYVHEQLLRLQKEEFPSCISDAICEKSYELAVQRHKEVVNTSFAVSEQPQQPASEPLFCKDTIYHASICSRIVSDTTYDAGNYQKAFKNQDVVPGHSFTSVSMSRKKHDPRSKQDRYLVAQKGESTYYFAFQSEPNLSEWGRLFHSFDEGTYMFR